MRKPPQPNPKSPVYRTVFFNQNSFLASSSIDTGVSGDASIQRLISDFRVEDVPYLGPVTAARGGSVIVPAHPDYWGAYDKAPVYSLMKALRGEGMGFLEVECRMDGFEALERSDPDIGFLIVVNGGELLYASDAEYGAALSGDDRALLESLREDAVLTEDGDIYAKASSADFDLAVLAYKKDFLLKQGRERYAPVTKELEYLENYFYLLKARYEERLAASIDVDERVRRETIPKMTLQQLVENCVKHGNMDACIRISVTGGVRDEGWTIRVQDNGPGVSEETLRELKDRLEEVRRSIRERAIEMEIGGMGIVNTYARCMLLYGEDLIFEMENVPEGGFAVTVGRKMLSVQRVTARGEGEKGNDHED